MSPYIKDAVIAIEDSRFYEHGGVDTTGILRALVSTARGNKQGASTITQQYVNNVINSSLEAEGKSDQVLLNGVNKGVGDKLREMKLAIALEKKFTKEQILEGYLNIVFFNRDAYGIEAASKFFFSTTAKDLTLPQAALLAGVVNSPSFYDPITNPDNAKVRRDLVLDMRCSAQGKITAGRLRRRRGHPGGNQGHPGPPGLRLRDDGPYFCDYVLHLLLNNPAYGADAAERERKIFRGGLTIKTTLDPKAQAVAQAQVDASAGANPDKWGASLVSVQPGTGKIISMAQNTVWFPADGKFDQTQELQRGPAGRERQRPQRPRRFPARLHHEALHVRGVAQRGQVDEHHAQRRRPPVPAELPLEEHLPGTDRRLRTTRTKGPARPMTCRTPTRATTSPCPSWTASTTPSTPITFASAAQLDFCGIQKVVDAVGIHSGLPTDGRTRTPRSP